MLKIICNICDKETKQADGFLFEATVIEQTVNLTGGNFSQSKGNQKKVIHICKECYEKHFKEKIYGKKEA